MKDQGNKNSFAEFAPDSVAAHQPTIHHAPHKMPKNLLQTIRIKNQQSHGPSPKQEQDQIIRSSSLLLRAGSGQANCQLCNQDFFTKNFFIADCEHKRMFCDSCMQHYAIYTIEQFSKVRCPNSGCSYELKIENAFFSSLPLTIQNKYRRIVRSYAAFQDVNVHLCPRACQSILATNQSSLSCGSCSGQFCRLCLLNSHAGECDESQRSFYEQTLKYRQCPKCLSVIGNFQGGNHLVCQCKHQFCYVCRVSWQADHRFYHDQHGNIMVPVHEENPKDTDAKNDPVVIYHQDSCCRRQPTCCFYLTIVPRVILFILAMGLVIALFGVLAVVTVLGLACMSKRKNRARPDTATERQFKKDGDECLQSMCSGYWSLYGIIAQNLLCP